MSPPTISDIKKAQRESVLYRHIAEFFHQPLLDNPALKEIMISRVVLSPDRRVCTIFFYTPGGKDHFKQIEKELTKYKAPLRKALSKQIAFRLTPELVFFYDKQFEKQSRIEELLEKVKEEDQAREETSQENTESSSPQESTEQE